MNTPFHHITQSKDYILSIGFHRLILFFVLLLVIFLTFYLSQVQFLEFKISVYGNSNKRQSFTNQTDTLSQSDKIVVISHAYENLDWLNLLDDEQIPYIVYTRSPNPLAHHRKLRINKGRDPAAYLRYIIDHYSNLPLSVAFVHGHRTSYHQENPSDIVTALRALQWHKYNYMPLTIRLTHHTFKANSSDLQERVNYELWEDVLQKELGPPPELGIVTHCCATFAIKREAILAHPAIFYSDILDYIMYTNYSDQYTSRSLEYTWHIIFGESTHICYKKCNIFLCDSKGNITVPMTKKKSKINYTIQE
ncbi:unnamed protein product [Rotaria sp. Silwood1]|nr:unnamed protein product [Rotaria sp. Silwood1]CAF3530004.1 unnamed protein product [Rotaria sp. Silwood1]CAF3647240.1 unnamed protein product [Rotaria sp. Silwood1]CAF4624957.1 unnamed protein product [Rotaria sp. Silwood1]